GQDGYFFYLCRWVSLLRPAPFELPQGRNAARVKGCSGAIKGAYSFLFLIFYKSNFHPEYSQKIVQNILNCLILPESPILFKIKQKSINPIGQEVNSHQFWFIK